MLITEPSCGQIYEMAGQYSRRAFVTYTEALDEFLKPGSENEIPEYKFMWILIRLILMNVIFSMKAGS
ncbi:MAG: hypothetical protein K9G58_12545 [Bacteroidales bacterium]|nr:hypothetical protein [Bacteroidales bacterium]MCF8388241.1 hypothetical protein [Bacteroidales bacterium]MCF8398995.1 hypothetical protein [Bacteroidales bacterium]